MKVNIERKTLHNNYYRKVLYTTRQMQLVLMSIPSGEEIGMEKHVSTTQFIRIEAGKGIAYVGDEKYRLRDGDSLMIPARVYHNIVNTGNKPLKLYTIYSPPEHKKGLIEK